MTTNLDYFLMSLDSLILWCEIVEENPPENDAVKQWDEEICIRRIDSTIRAAKEV